MTDLAVFLRAILDNPHDPAPRLIFADWLHEQGDDARGEWCQITNALENPPKRWVPDVNKSSIYTDSLQMLYNVHNAELINQELRQKERLKELRALPLGPLPRPASAPQLADVLRAWAGSWPHEDDSLRPLVCWWLGAVEWDHARAAQVQSIQIRECPNGGQPSWTVNIRDLKRRVLALFPEVEITLRYYWAEEQWNALQDHRIIGETLRRHGFRTDLFMHPRSYERYDREQRFVEHFQTLRAPDWIAPEPAHPRDERGQFTGSRIPDLPMVR